MKGKVMLRLSFIFFIAFSGIVQAASPQKCTGNYIYVKDIGNWNLNNGFWSLPFTCTNGVKTKISVAEKEVSNIGRRRFFIETVPEEDDYFFVGPCGAIGRFCQSQRFDGRFTKRKLRQSEDAKE